MQNNDASNMVSQGSGKVSPGSAGFDQLQSHLEQVQQALNRQLADIAAQVAEAESVALERARADLMRQMEAERAALTVQRDHVAAMQAQMDEQRRQVESELAGLEEARQAIENQKQGVQRRANELDSEAAAVTHMRQELARQREDLEKQLVEIGRTRSEVQNRRDQFARQTRRTVELLRQQQKKQLEKLEQARKELDEHKRTIKQQAAQESEQERKQLEAERASLENLREGMAVRQEEIQRRQAEQRQRQAELDKRGAALDQKQREVEQAQIGMEAHRRHHARRLARLRKVKQILARQEQEMAREKASLDTTRKCARQVVEQRDSVMEMQRLLLEAEHRMIFRWGLEKSLGWIGRGLIAVMVLMLGSYLVAEQLSHRTWAANAIVQHDATGGNAQTFLAELQQRLATEQMQRDIIQHLQQQGGGLAARPAQVPQMLSENLTLYSPAAGTVLLELRGPDRDQLVPVLSAVTRVLAGTRSLTSKSLPEQPPLRLSQEPKLVATPVENNHLTLAATFFGFSMPVVVLLVAAMAWMLCRTARRETESIELRADSPLWQTMAQDLQAVSEGPKPTADEATRTAAPLL